MTAEIAILNKEAVALAADSAVTFSRPAGEKVLTSANKIFALSKYHPVGVMVYGSGEFMELPWETIVKVYRAKLGKRSFATLREYADDLLGFLSKEREICTLSKKATSGPACMVTSGTYETASQPKSKPLSAAGKRLQTGRSRASRGESWKSITDCG